MRGRSSRTRGSSSPPIFLPELHIVTRDDNTCAAGTDLIQLPNPKASPKTSSPNPKDDLSIRNLFQFGNPGLFNIQLRCDEFFSRPPQSDCFCSLYRRGRGLVQGSHSCGLKRITCARLLPAGHFEYTGSAVDDCQVQTIRRISNSGPLNQVANQLVVMQPACARASTSAECLYMNIYMYRQICGFGAENLASSPSRMQEALIRVQHIST